MSGGDHGDGKSCRSPDAGTGSGGPPARGASVRGAQRGTRTVRARPARVVPGAGAEGTGYAPDASRARRVEGCREDRGSGGSDVGAAPRASLFCLGGARWEVSLLRASGESPARASWRGQVCDSDGGEEPVGGGSRDRLQGAERCGTRLRAFEGSAVGAAGISSPGATRARPCVCGRTGLPAGPGAPTADPSNRSEEHTSELQSQSNLVCRLLLEKKKKNK